MIKYEFMVNNGWRLVAAPFIFSRVWSIVIHYGSTVGVAGVVVWMGWATCEIAFPSRIHGLHPDHRPLARLVFAAIVALAWTGIGYGSIGVIKIILLVALYRANWF